MFEELTHAVFTIKSALLKHFLPILQNLVLLEFTYAENSHSHRVYNDHKKPAFIKPKGCII
jgi:hypothetical protein